MPVVGIAFTVTFTRDGTKYVEPFVRSSTVYSPGAGKVISKVPFVEVVVLSAVCSSPFFMTLISAFEGETTLPQEQPYAVNVLAAPTSAVSTAGLK